MTGAELVLTKDAWVEVDSKEKGHGDSASLKLPTTNNTYHFLFMHLCLLLAGSSF